jgi:hypothetical protein
VGRQLHGPAALSPDTYWIGDWMVPIAGLDDTEKWKLLTLPGLEPRPLCRQAFSQSLDRLRYHGSGRWKFKLQTSWTKKDWKLRHKIVLLHIYLSNYLPEEKEQEFNSIKLVLHPLDGRYRQLAITGPLHFILSAAVQKREFIASFS